MCKTCDWSQQPDYDNEWETECGKIFVSQEGDYPHDMDMRFCCFCGGKLFQFPHTEEDHE